MKKEYIKLKYPKAKIVGGIGLLIILGSCIVLQNTVLMRNYLLNTIVNVILKNDINIVILSILLIAINVLQIESIRRKFKDEGE